MPSLARPRRTRDRIQRTSPSGRRQRYSMSAPSPLSRASSKTCRSSGRMPLTARSRLNHSCRSNPAMSHRPGDHSNTVSPGSSICLQWPVRARLSMELKTSLCSCNSRRASSSARSDAASAARRVSASETSRTVTMMLLLATLATLRADISHASTGRPGSRTTGRHSSGTPARATAHNCSTMPTPCIRSNTSSASVPGPRTAPSPGMRRAAALAATSTRRTPSSRNSISARGSTSKKACRRACAEGASTPSPSGVRRSVSNSDEITFEHNPLVKRMFAWTRRRKARPHSPHRVCQKVTAT